MSSNPPPSIFRDKIFELVIFSNPISFDRGESHSTNYLYLTSLPTRFSEKIFPKTYQSFSWVLSLMEKSSNFFKFLFFKLAYNLREQALTLILVQLSWLPCVDFSGYVYKTWPKFSLTINSTPKDQNFWIFKFDGIWQRWIPIEWWWVAFDLITLGSQDIYFFFIICI